MKKALYATITILADVLSVFVVNLFCIYGSFFVPNLTGGQVFSLIIYSSCFAAALCLAFFAFGIYKLLTNNFGMLEAIKIALIVFSVSTIGWLIVHFLPRDLLLEYKLSVFCLGAVTLVFFCDGFRTLKRVLAYLIALKQKRRMPLKRTLVIGAGSAAKIIIDDSRNNLNSKNDVIVLVDDSPDKIGRSFSSIPVVGPIASVSTYVDKYKIDEVIIAIQVLTKERLHEIISYLGDSDVEIRRLPILSELDTVNAKAILDVDINEILGRPTVVLDNSGITSMLHGQSVLITGAGGSIGSELVRQIYKTHPSTLVLFDIYENGVYSIQQEIIRQMRRENITDVKLVTLIGSTYNEIRMEQVISEYKPDYIYHAAAYKHVPLMEESPVEAVRTNDIGTYNIAKLAIKYGVKKMLLVSTDKAVRPTNAMGASKRFAEMIIQYFSSISKTTKYCAVRFGNVLGSNGSVIPLFSKQIEEGGPVTVTDPNIIRYFMTIPEAVGLILQSSIYSDGGEIFILDMGKPVKILTLAEKMIRQAGFVPYKDIKIVFTGLRPGEKLYEETLLNPQSQKKTANNRIFIEKRGKIEPVEKEMKQIESLFGFGTFPNDVKKELSNLVSTYKPEMND